MPLHYIFFFPGEYRLICLPKHTDDSSKAKESWAKRKH